MMQGGAIIKAPGTATAGSSIVVEVAANTESVQVTFGGSEGTKSFPVPEGGNVVIPIPPGTTGAISIHFGQGVSRRGTTVEIVATGP